jgi:hypothetical protein
VDDLLDERAVKSLNSLISKERDIITLSSAGDGKVNLVSHRRAFLIEMDKATGMPGISTLGGTFENEQEISGLRSIKRSKILQGFTQAELDANLAPKPAPVTGPPN